MHLHLSPIQKNSRFYVGKIKNVIHTEVVEAVVTGRRRVLVRPLQDPKVLPDIPAAVDFRPFV
jgi:hypothetical protein